MATTVRFQHQTPAPSAGRARRASVHPPSKHFQVGKDYAHAAHRHGDGESMLKSRISGTLTYPRPRKADLI
jgi:hypothetical protein